MRLITAPITCAVCEREPATMKIPFSKDNWTVHVPLCSYECMALLQANVEFYEFCERGHADS